MFVLGCDGGGELGFDGSMLLFLFLFRDVGSVDVYNFLMDLEIGLLVGNLEGDCAILVEVGPEDISSPDCVVGSGMLESCIVDVFIDVVVMGGVIIFDCGFDLVIIMFDCLVCIFNDMGSCIVIDGGGFVMLSGGGVICIFYMNICDLDLMWIMFYCDD